MIIVKYKNDILGEGEFWRGDESDIQQIRNIPARNLAEMIILNGQFVASSGMWTVERV